jgi:hypothetical protein
VGLARFELATTGLGNRCSIHLSYSPCQQILSRTECELADVTKHGMADVHSASSRVGSSGIPYNQW